MLLLVKDRGFCSNQRLQEKFEDTKRVIRIRQSEDRQINGQTIKDKRANNDLQNTTHITKDRAIRTPLKNQG